MLETTHRESTNNTQRPRSRSPTSITSSSECIICYAKLIAQDDIWSCAVCKAVTCFECRPRQDQRGHVRCFSCRSSRGDVMRIFGGPWICNEVGRLCYLCRSVIKQGERYKRCARSSSTCVASWHADDADCRGTTDSVGPCQLPTSVPRHRWMPMDLVNCPSCFGSGNNVLIERRTVSREIPKVEIE